MNNIPKIKDVRGNVTIIALMILVVLTMLGLSASRTSTIDMQIARNQIPYKESFYIAEGGQNREAAEIGQGNYPVININNTDDTLATEAGEKDSPNSLPGGYPHKVLEEEYNFSVKYKGYYPPPAGYSIIHFSRYDYTVDTEGGDSNVKIASRYYKIGPKAE